MEKIKSFKPRRAGAKKFNSRYSSRAIKQSMYKESKWINFRKKFIARNPRCYTCGEPSKVCDHIEPHKSDYKKFYNPHNIMPLCTTCHNTVSAKFDAKNDLEGKAAWIIKMREERNFSFPIRFTEF